MKDVPEEWTRTLELAEAAVSAREMRSLARLTLTDGRVVVGRPWVSVMMRPEWTGGCPRTLADFMSSPAAYDMTIVVPVVGRPRTLADFMSPAAYDMTIVVPVVEVCASGVVHTKHIMSVKPGWFGAGQHCVEPELYGAGWLCCQYPRPTGRTGAGTSWFHCVLTAELMAGLLTAWRPDSPHAIGVLRFIDETKRLHPGLLESMPRQDAPKEPCC